MVFVKCFVIKLLKGVYKYGKKYGEKFYSNVKGIRSITPIDEINLNMTYNR